MQLGKYKIIRELGRGGFGIVYLAKDLTLERMVALKVLHPQLTIDMKFTQTFQREARNLAQIDHSNVVTIFEIGEIEGRIYIAMRYLPGGNLSERLKAEGPIPQAEALRIISQVAQGLRAGHDHGIIHRDVKPGNILFDGEGQAVIADFGVARVVALSSLGTSSESGGAAGTPYYRPPELWRGSPPPSAASDVYSLGCVFYELLTGQVLFSGDTPDQVLTRHVLDDPYSLMKQGGNVFSQAILDVLEKALAKEPLDRFQSVDEFSQKLMQAAEIPASAGKQARILQEIPSKPTSARIKAVDKFEKQLNDPPPKKPQSKVALLAVMAVLIVAVSMRVWTSNQHKESLPGQQTATVTLLTSAISNDAFTKLPTRTLAEIAVGTPNITSLPASTKVLTVSPTKGPTHQPETGNGQTRVRDKDEMEQIYVPASSFTMGSKNGDTDEKPVHSVYMNEFWIDKYEVSNGQYEKCVSAGACTAPSDLSSYTRLSYYGDLAFTDYPVIYVNWDQAKEYCKWIGGRLPTEAEWEKAARGDMDARSYSWGEGIDARKANYCDKNCPFESKDISIDDGYVDTAPVGNYPAGASPYGVMDMAGNVYEWVADWYDGAYYSSEKSWRNPAGPTIGQFRVIRGGSWVKDMGSLRVSFRQNYFPDRSYYSIGFRCVNSP